MSTMLTSFNEKKASAGHIGRKRANLKHYPGEHALPSGRALAGAADALAIVEDALRISSVTDVSHPTASSLK
ncbi:MAG TPA: hypothetical protein VJ742_06750 [Nitrososphaera sp.]|nr:hypothetical protein [Nitrososphaera sp.]